ncbi:preprotein translocase subunit SecA [Rubinisphaera italica]|uniref:Protein translocase subunit SecA n=1 Tax=Rubinisphaera italica TaxID=2527969 RepID=A0A5C5X9Y9_9PLAN|nr:DEAD/DEAH box helicase [Rubinisphaera italica]TWT59780.1 preprotein translocase subunit SecA [Rubinisphaera italica]
MRHGRLRKQASMILALAGRYARSSEAELLERARQLQWAAKSGKALKRLLPEAYAIGIVASERHLGLRHYPVQILAAIELFAGRVVEMQTGEGKTLTAVLPVFLRSLPGKGVHVITANEYLAQRDAKQMRPVFAALGMSCGCLHSKLPHGERQQQYRCDITYGTASEFGFDFLRDRLQGRTSELVANDNQQFLQRTHEFALIDEADSILIDEARTPLIIGVDQGSLAERNHLFGWARNQVSKLTAETDYLIDAKTRSVSLTRQGGRAVIASIKPIKIASFSTEKLFDAVEKAITAELIFQLGRDYVIDDGEIVIIDEGTGRKLEGRKWQAGLHQAIEAKENLEVTSETGSAARITIQSYFRRYNHLAGMTGTATPVRLDLRRVYKLHVSEIPTHRVCRRIGSRPRIFPTQQLKNAAILQSIREYLKLGRAILVGTPSVYASATLAEELTKAGIPHRVLNAILHDQEAEIVQQAGQRDRVTIATNMAGRGSDIPLDTYVKEHGGLHVIATEMHLSRRIDRQLIGRCARQGDPGSYQFFLSLEDELFRILPFDQYQRMLAQISGKSSSELPLKWLRVFQRLQRRQERLDSRAIRRLLRVEKDRTKHMENASLDPFLHATDR